MEDLPEAEEGHGVRVSGFWWGVLYGALLLLGIGVMPDGPWWSRLLSTVLLMSAGIVLAHGRED